MAAQQMTAEDLRILLVESLKYSEIFLMRNYILILSHLSPPSFFMFQGGL